jgi:hypothetical protein
MARVAGGRRPLSASEREERWLGREREGGEN